MADYSLALGSKQSISVCFKSQSWVMNYRRPACFRVLETDEDDERGPHFSYASYSKFAPHKYLFVNLVCTLSARADMCLLRCSCRY